MDLKIGAIITNAGGIGRVRYGRTPAIRPVVEGRVADIDPAGQILATVDEVEIAFIRHRRPDDVEIKTG